MPRAATGGNIALVVSAISVIATIVPRVSSTTRSKAWSILGIDSPGIEARFWSKVSANARLLLACVAGGGQPYGHFATDARRATRAQG